IDAPGAPHVTATSNDTLFYDPSDPSVIRNPHPIHERLRDEAPLYHHPDQDFYAVSRFADVERVLVDRDTRRLAPGGEPGTVQRRSKRSSSITLFHAATKWSTNSPSALSAP
ncbi:MAG TPA: hypothetical protein VIY72_03860, partial [Acidimicrobiales bacterium]